MTHTAAQCIMDRLGADSVSEHVAALDEAIKSQHLFQLNDRKSIATAAIEALRRSRYRYGLAGKIAQLGDEIVQPSMELFGQNIDSELKFFLAVILLGKGERIGVPTLLSEVELDREFLPFACYLLSNTGVTELSPRLIRVLAEIPFGESASVPTEQHDLVCTLLRCLAKLQSKLPRELSLKFNDLQTSAYIRETIQKLWPSGE